MKNILSSAAYQAAQSLKRQGFEAVRSHLGHVIAAALGYGSHEALVLEEKDNKLPWHLGDAEVWVLNLGQAQERATGLNLPGNAFEVCAEALKSVSTIPVFFGIDPWWDEYMRQILEDELVDADEVHSAIADSNAYFEHTPDLDSGAYFTANLWSSSDTWEVSAEGTMCGDFDLEGDRPLTGDVIELGVNVIFAKAGRAGLVRQETEVRAGVRVEPDEDDPDEAYERSMDNPHA